MFPLNMQPAERRVEQSIPAGLIELVHVWHTIQGEGPLTGTPAIFIRLAGCNLRCLQCDTNYTTNRRYEDPAEIVRSLEKFGRWPNRDLIVLTGGEPFRQPIGDLVRQLVLARYPVQIETNGTLYRDDLPYASDLLTIVCSPKVNFIAEELMPHIHSLKYVVSDGLVDDDGLPLITLGSTRPARPWAGFRGDVFIQPADEPGSPAKTSANLEAAKRVAMKHGFRLSLQTHKLLGVE